METLITRESLLQGALCSIQRFNHEERCGHRTETRRDGYLLKDKETGRSAEYNSGCWRNGSMSINALNRQLAAIVPSSLSAMLTSALHASAIFFKADCPVIEQA